MKKTRMCRLAAITVAAGASMMLVAPTVSATTTSHSQPLQWVRGINATITNESSWKVMRINLRNQDGPIKSTVVKPGESIHGHAPWTHGFRSSVIKGTINVDGKDRTDFEIENPSVGTPVILMTVANTSKDQVFSLIDGSHAFQFAGHDYGYTRSGDDSSNKNITLRIFN